MTRFLDDFFGTAGLVPLGAAMQWRPDLVALHAISDGLIALASLVIAAAIAVFLSRRRDLAPSARLVAGLLMACTVAGSLSHIAGLVTLWSPAFGAQGLFKALTAGAAVATAVLIWPQIPRLLALPSPRDLARANLALVQSNASLETTIAWRTHEIELARQRFEQALSRSNITVFTQDTDLRYTWIHNPRLGLSEAQILGHKAEELMPFEAVDELLALKRRALDTGRSASGTVAVPTGNEGRLFLDMTVSPTVDLHGEIDGILCTAVDVTEKRLFEVRLASMAAQLGTAYQRFELALENSAITVFEQDADLRYTYVYNPPPGSGPEDFIDRTDAEIFPEAEQRRILPPKQRVLASGGREKLELEVEIAGKLRFFDLTLEAKTSDDGKVEGVIGTALDLTERRRDERRMRLMMRELTHRSKNLLAVIQAMARKTASMSDDIDEFVADFSPAAACDGRRARPAGLGVLERRRPGRADPRQRRADHHPDR